MTYKSEDDRVTLEMSREDYGQLLLLLGMALGASGGGESFSRILMFVNELNRTNPNFTPYEVSKPK
jgi:hypothetical protein